MRIPKAGGRGFAAAVAASVVVGGLATAATADTGDKSTGTKAPAASSQQGKLKKAKSKDKFGQHDRDLLAKAVTGKQQRVKLIISTQKGQTETTVAGVKALGGYVVNHVNKLGYVLASVPTANATKVGDLASVRSIDLDEVIQMPDVHVGAEKAGTNAASAAVAAQPAPGASTPDANPYMPTQDIGSVTFKTAHPTWDGRGTTIGIMDSGVDLDHPALQTTSTGERKISDWVTATDPVFDNDATWRLMLNTVQGATAAYPGTSTIYTLPDATTAYKINRFSEAITAASEPGGDVNRDGDTTDRFGVLYNPVSHDIWVDSNQNLVFEAGEKMAPYAVNHQVGHFGTCAVDAFGLRHCMPFVVEYREDVDITPYGYPAGSVADFVNIGITEDAHASHVAGIAAGHSLFGGAMDGQAPGAKIVSSRACTWGGGCTAAALTDGMIDLALNRGVDVINMSIGGLPALNDANNARADLYDAIINELGVQLVISAGNSGAGINTIGDPAVATNVMAVASSITKATWLSNYGAEVSSPLNLHNYSSRGPREDGGFKPNVSAPGSAVSSVPLWLKQPDVADTGYQLPVGYAMFNGTSMASPQAAGASALLLSAAKATGKSVTPLQLRESVYSSAKQIPGVPVLGQGTGQYDVNGAWATLSANPTIDGYTVDAPVCTPISGFLKVPNRGTGIYNRCAPGQGGQPIHKANPYKVTVTRTSGAAGVVTHNITWVGNDGTFKTGSTVDLPLNTPVQVTVVAKTDVIGQHSAFMVLDDPATKLQDLRVMAAVVLSETPAASSYKLAKSGSVERNRFTSYFVNVPAGTDALTVKLSGVAAGSQVRWIANHPYGVPIESTSSLACYTNFSNPATCNPTVRSYESPLPGVWEIVVEARRTTPTLANSFAITAELKGVTVTPATQTVTGTAGAATPVTWTVRNDLAPIILEPKGGPLGSALAERKTIADGATQDFAVAVPAGATSFTAKIGSTSDLGADLDLYVYGPSGALVAQSADGDSEEAVTIVNPAAGTYTVEVDGYSVPSGSTSYDYLDAFYSPALGSLNITSAPAVSLASGATTTVTGAIQALMQPAAGRQLSGQMRATSDGATIGTGSVLVASP